MSEDKKGSWQRPFERLFRTCLLVLGSAITLDIAIGYIRVILPWLIGAGSVVAVGWMVTAIVRWRRSRW